MNIRPARFLDLPAVHRLLEAASLPDRDIDSHLATLLVGERQGEVIAAGALEPLGRDCLLRSVVVKPAYRQRGWGARMSERLLLLARDLGMFDVYLLTSDAVGFFAAKGFAQTLRHGAPGMVQRTRQFSELCPSASVLMHLRLGEPQFLSGLRCIRAAEISTTEPASPR